MNDIQAKVKALIAKKLDVDLSLVTNDKSFVEDFGADSLDIIELIMALEDEFFIDIHDEDAQEITTVQSAVVYVLEHSKFSLNN